MSDPRAPLPPAVGPSGTPLFQPVVLPATPGASRRRFQRTLVSVLIVQLVALLLLWMVQAHFTH